MRDLHALLRGRGAEGYVPSGFGGLGLPNDGRHRRRHCLGLLQGRRFRAALLPGIPPLARGALLVGGQLRAVLVADEARTRAARPIRAAFHATAHVQGPAWAGRLRRDADDALSGYRRRQLPLRLEPAVPLENALLLGGGKLLGVILAEPPVARAGTRLSAGRHWTEPPRDPPSRAPRRAAPRSLDTRQGQRDLLLDVMGDGCGQLAREAIDQRAERSFLRSIGHWRFSDSDNGRGHRAARTRRFYPVAPDQASEKRTTCRIALCAWSSTVPGASFAAPPPPLALASARPAGPAQPSAPPLAAPARNRLPARVPPARLLPPS